MNGVVPSVFREAVLAILARRPEALSKMSIEIGCVDGAWTYLISNAVESTLAELQQIVKYTLPRINAIELRVSEDHNLTEESDLFLLYRFAPFVEISVFSFSKAIGNFLQIQLQSDILKSLAVAHQMAVTGGLSTLDKRGGT